MLQRVEVCCSVLQCVAVRLHQIMLISGVSVLQRVAVRCIPSASEYVDIWSKCVAVCCSSLKCVAVCCSVLQCVAVRLHQIMLISGVSVL